MFCLKASNFVSDKNTVVSTAIQTFRLNSIKVLVFFILQLDFVVPQTLVINTEIWGSLYKLNGVRTFFRILLHKHKKRVTVIATFY